MDDTVKQISSRLAAGGVNIVFTGAGISTESGIPDYRSKGGIWENYKPVTFDEFMSSRDSRVTYWSRKAELYPDLVKAEPNPGHEALVSLYEKKMLEAVITQNIDGLHQAAGLPEDRVIELHGNTLRARCMSCDAVVSIHEIQQRIECGDAAPECDCGGFFKSDTVSFGQSLPEDEYTRAVELSQTCDVFLVVGSTLVVQPASLLPVFAKQNGAFLAIINLSETPCDGMADVLIREKAGEVLPRVLEELDKGRRARR